MQYDEKMQRTKKVIILLTVIIVSIISINLWLNIKRSDKIATTFEVMPTDAKIIIDGKKSRAGMVYLSPGTYKITASKDGFSDVKKTIAITQNNNYVGLILPAVSDEAKKWAASDAVWPELERIAGEISRYQSSSLRDKTPLINYLPESNIMGPYTISYSVFGVGDNEQVTIIIKNSTPNGRLKALQWIRDQGVDPADLIIEFEDFHNPTNQGDV